MTEFVFSCQDGMLFHKDNLYLNKNSKFKAKMLQEFHESPRRGREDFYWDGMQKEVKDFVERCVTCQTIKYSTTAPSGLL